MEIVTNEERLRFLNEAKPRTGFNFKFIDNFNVSEIKRLLDGYTKDQWISEGIIQTSFKVQENVDFLIIVDTHKPSRYTFPFFSYAHLEHLELLAATTPIIRRLEQEFGDQGKVARAMFCNLLPGITIPEHTDQHPNGDANVPFLLVSHRYHVPIVTNDKVWFDINGENKHMTTGECWEINNNIRHSVGNDGDTNRIHLIIDILPHKWL